MRNIPFSPPDITNTEIEKVIEVLKSGWITTGSKTKDFEKKIAEYCNTEKAVCLNSATAALELTLRILGIGEGDEVITSAYTYTATASIINHVGAKIVLVDTAENSYEMDIEKIANAITSKTKAIIPVDIAGVMCDYESIIKVLNSKRDLFTPNNNIQEAIGRVVVVSDGAHSFGAKQKEKMSGEIADFTSFSFHAVKNLTTAEGGAVTWRNIEGISNEDIYKQYMILSLHGQTKDALSKSQLGLWEYDILIPAFKCNMTDIMAAIGLAQLDRYNSMLRYRKKIISKYDDALVDNEKLHILRHYTNESSSSGHLYLVRVMGIDEGRRNEIIVKMAEAGIATNVHYKPLPMLSAYKNLGFDIKDYPNAFNMYKNEISLPLHSCLTMSDIEFIIDSFIKIIN